MFIYSAFIFTGIFVLGLILGSYLNSWIWRIHEGKYQFGGRSMCVHCGRQLVWKENIPLFSFLFLKGKCATCKKPIPFDYFLVELFTAVSALLLSVYHVSAGSGAAVLIRDFVFTGLLIVTFVYDAKYRIILSGVTWLGAIFGFILNFFYLGYSITSMLIGILIGGGFFLLQYLVSKGRWIGGGDVRFGVLMGVWLGWPNILLGLLLSYILGSLVAIPLLALKRKEMSSEVPFGTFLAVSTFLTLLWGHGVVRWYLGLF